MGSDNLKVLNRNQIKYILIIAMTIDHIAWAFVPTLSVLGQVMHFIGRLTGPSMALLLAEGYQYTKNKKAYAVRLGIFALISWVPYSLYETGKFPFMNLGMILTLFIAFMTILMWDKLKAPKAVKIILVIVSCFLSLFGDWSIFAVLWALFAYIYRDRPRAKWTSFAIVAAVEVLIANLIDILNERPFANLHQTGIILVPILLTVFYNRKKGSGAKIHKWFFYVYYPLHLLIFYLIKLYIYKG